LEFSNAASFVDLAGEDGCEDCGDLAGDAILVVATPYEIT